MFNFKLKPLVLKLTCRPTTATTYDVPRKVDERHAEGGQVQCLVRRRVAYIILPLIHPSLTSLQA
ncbi:MAG: hypothetical protein MSG64_02520 [Pyrinomonadaceae bacterium MAG19_C2-C3]|nr:hypothetical protein [Pyrinomonadaceae bacterium MAG19_C2-C3]